MFCANDASYVETLTPEYRVSHMKKLLVEKGNHIGPAMEKLLAEAIVCQGAGFVSESPEMVLAEVRAQRAAAAAAQSATASPDSKKAADTGKTDSPFNRENSTRSSASDAAAAPGKPAESGPPFVFPTFSFGKPPGDQDSASSDGFSRQNTHTESSTPGRRTGSSTPPQARATFGQPNAALGRRRKKIKLF